MFIYFFFLFLFSVFIFYFHIIFMPKAFLSAGASHPPYNFHPALAELHPSQTDLFANVPLRSDMHHIYAYHEEILVSIMKKFGVLS